MFKGIHSFAVIGTAYRDNEKDYVKTMEYLFQLEPTLSEETDDSSQKVASNVVPQKASGNLICELVN